eukprot:gene10012-20838_t
MFGTYDSQFLQRESLINPTGRFGSDYIAFSEEIIRSFTRSVNAVQWIKSGDKMLPGSDDRTVKIWDSSCDLNSIKCLHTVRTEHNSNIFCVDIDENREQFILSCAADGTLRSSDIYSITGQSINTLYVIASHIYVIPHRNMFICDRLNRNIVYTAEESGTITRIDLRDNHPVIVLHRRLGVKTICQPNTGSSHLLIFGGHGFRVEELDLRRSMTVGDRSKVVVRTWMPQGLLAEMEIRYISLITRMDVWRSQFPFPAPIPDSVLRETPIDVLMVTAQIEYTTPEVPKACLGGHINADTFLKKAAFFGPSDEYVVTGCDSGYVWIWSSSSGQLLEQKERVTNEDEFGIVKLINVLDADRRISNGVVPHPVLPVLASYGIDSDVKLWLHETPDEDEDEDRDEKESGVVSRQGHSMSKRGASITTSTITGRNNLQKTTSKSYSAIKEIPSILDASLKKTSPLYGEDFIIDVARRLLTPEVSNSEQKVEIKEPLSKSDARQIDVVDDLPGWHKEDVCNEKMADLIKYQRILAGIRYDLDKRRRNENNRSNKKEEWVIPDRPVDLGFVPGQSISQMMTVTVDDLRHRLMEVYTEEEAHRMAVLIILQLIKIVDDAKQEGNIHFKASRWVDTEACYGSGIRYAGIVRVCFHALLENLDSLKLKNFILLTPDNEIISKRHFKRPHVSRDQDINGTVPDSIVTASSTSTATATSPSLIEERSARSCAEMETESEVVTESNSSEKSTEHPFVEVLSCIWYGKQEENSESTSSSSTLYALEKAIYSNQAARCLQQSDFRGTLHFCKLAIELSPDMPRTWTMGLHPDSKLLYRQGCAYLGLKQHKEALASFSQALAMNPVDVTVIKNMKETKREMEEVREEKQKQYKKMFT